MFHPWQMQEAYLIFETIARTRGQEQNRRGLIFPLTIVSGQGGPIWLPPSLVWKLLQPKSGPPCGTLSGHEETAGKTTCELDVFHWSGSHHQAMSFNGEHLHVGPSKNPLKSLQSVWPSLTYHSKIKGIFRYGLSSLNVKYATHTQTHKDCVLAP